jgi:hypothetical protein
MFEVEKRLKAIMEGATLPTNNDPNSYEDDYDQGGVNDIMIMEAIVEIFMSESEVVGDQMFSESSLEGISLVQLLREVTEKEIRDDVEMKRTRWQKFKEGLKRFFNAPFDPYGGLKELKLVNELIKDDTSAGIAAAIPYLGLFIIIAQRAAKYKQFPRELAEQYITEAKKHREYLNKIANNLEKDAADKRYKKATKRVRKQIKHLDAWMMEFERRAIDKAWV